MWIFEDYKTSILSKLEEPCANCQLILFKVDLLLHLMKIKLEYCGPFYCGNKLRVWRVDYFLKYIQTMVMWSVCVTRLVIFRVCVETLVGFFFAFLPLKLNQINIFLQRTASSIFCQRNTTYIRLLKKSKYKYKKYIP